LNLGMPAPTLGMPAPNLGMLALNLGMPALTLGMAALNPDMLMPPVGPRASWRLGRASGLSPA
jgi:hypothetical protein